MPIVIITSGALIVLMLALLQSIVSMRTITNYSYYNKLAEEAAEAGTVYAGACLEANGRTPTWGSTSTTSLTEHSDCNGTQNVFAATTTSGVYASLPIKFTVGAIEATPSSVNIASIGSTTMPGMSLPILGYINKSITWPVSLIGQRSVSGAYRTCGIMSGAVYCWGRNAVGQLGNGVHSAITTDPSDEDPAVDTLTPVKVVREVGVLSGKYVEDIFAAAYHNCALTDEGKVYCWGHNNYGQLGTGDKLNRDKPVEVKGLLEGKVVTAIGGTNNTSCAIAEGKIYCWGNGASGTVGNGSTTSSNTTPTAVVTGVTNGLSSSYTATKLSSSGSLSATMCAVADGKAYCWGHNAYGQVGDGSTTNRTAPRKVVDTGVLSGKTVTDISQDGSSGETTHACAVANGRAYCWGDNGNGVLGNNSTTDSTTPVAVSTSGVLNGKTITRIVAGMYHTCAMTSEDKIVCWGYNGYGQLGNNSTTTSRVPVYIYQNGQIVDEVISDLGGGTNRGCAVVKSGKSYCWGLNSSAGQIGDGTRINRKVPTESIFLRPQNNEFIY